MQTREEVMIQMGVDNTTLIRDLKTTKDVVDSIMQQTMKSSQKAVEAMRSRLTGANSDAAGRFGKDSIFKDDPEKSRLADVEEASRRNQARRLLRLREEEREKKLAHLQEMKRRSEEDLAHEKSFKNRMQFLKAIGKLGGAMAILNAPQIADHILETVSSSAKRLGGIVNDWMTILSGNRLDENPGGSFDNMKEAERQKAHAENNKRFAEEKQANEELHELRMRQLQEESNRAHSIIESNSERKKRIEEQTIRDQFTDEQWLAKKKTELDLKEQQFKNATFATAEKRAAAEQEILDIREQVLSTEQKINNAQRSRIEGIHDSFFSARDAVMSDRQVSTVDELANAWGSMYQDEAQRIQQLARFEKYNRSGFRDSDTKLADAQQEERLRLTKYLQDQGSIARNPVVEAIDSLNETVAKGVSVKELQGDD